MIIGNVADYIERCLSSFAPLADEICIVRAIGCLPPDRTLDIAKEKFGARTCDYKNARGHEDWPHVDNFAAARQMSFDMATNDYCFWCDSDDILANPEESAKWLREHAALGKFACYMLPYDCFGRSVIPYRERLVRKSAGKWEQAVHEHFEFFQKPVQAFEDSRIVVRHMPHLGGKDTSNGRNLRILRGVPNELKTTSEWFHLHQEELLAGNEEAAVKAAATTLERPDLGRAEKREIYLNLGVHVRDNPAARETMFHAAYQADPRRREALYLLTNHALDNGRPADALAYARQMMVTVAPEGREWNDRPSLYDWAGAEMMTQALRANDMKEQAEKMRLAILARAGGPRIALVHATRGRPEKASATRRLWLSLAEKPDAVEHLFVIDEDDKISAPLKRMHTLIAPAGGGCVRAWNMGAFATEAPVIVQLSDDFEPIPRWDEIILERLRNGKANNQNTADANLLAAGLLNGAAAGDPLGEPKVLAVSDGLRDDKLLCIAIFTRAYLHYDYFMFHPWFKSVYSDDWFTQCAYERNAVIEARDLVFKHQHFLKTGVAPDATYLAQNAPERYQEGNLVLNDLRMKRDWSSVPGFFNYWMFYERIAGTLKDGETVAEVGVFLGRSIIYLAQECRRLGKKVRFLAIDNFMGQTGEAAHLPAVQAGGGNFRSLFEEHLKRCGVADMVEIIEGDSARAAASIPDASLAFCWIDAAHDYDSVCRDIDAWAPKVKPDGILAGHDVQIESVRKAVAEKLPSAKSTGCLWVK